MELLKMKQPVNDKSKPEAILMDRTTKKVLSVIYKPENKSDEKKILDYFKYIFKDPQDLTKKEVDAWQLINYFKDCIILFEKIVKSPHYSLDRVQLLQIGLMEKLISHYNGELQKKQQIIDKLLMKL